MRYICNQNSVSAMFNLGNRDGVVDKANQTRDDNASMHAHTHTHTPKIFEK